MLPHRGEALFRQREPGTLFRMTAEQPLIEMLLNRLAMHRQYRNGRFDRGDWSLRST